MRGFSRRTAAPDGGATSWVRGCALLLALATPAFADIAVPSGQAVTLSEVLVDEVGAQNWVRFRFLAPQIARGAHALSFEEAGADIDALCAQIAVPYLGEWDLSPDMVVISLSDRAVPFGQRDPEATQFFEAYRVEDGTCIWEEL
ncbi:MAG: DUF6497 family protein [Pseudomonadota bacterium]